MYKLNKNVNTPFSSPFRLNASSAALGMTTLTGRLTGLKPTPYKSTTWLTTCGCSNENRQWPKFEMFQLFLITSLCPPVCRFFLMYLINKDETEHTGQVCDTFKSRQHFDVRCRLSWIPRRISLKTAKQDYRNFSRFYLCNISTHLLCCIRAAGGRSNAWAHFDFCDINLLLSCTWASSWFIWCSCIALMPQI